ncbi:lactonase family protein [bacterium]|nr:MAG: lactonase family protein [bacterium]
MHENHENDREPTERIDAGIPGGRSLGFRKTLDVKTDPWQGSRLRRLDNRHKEDFRYRKRVSNTYQGLCRPAKPPWEIVPNGAGSATIGDMPDDVTLYLGTYTSEGGSRGIYRARLDLATGQLSKPEFVAEAKNPSFLALHPAGRFLYAVQEADGGSVSAYAVGPDGGLTLLNSRLSEGSAPCHITVDPFARNVLVANYGNGTAACFPIANDGSLAPVSWKFQNSGTGPNAGRQEGPHMHAIVPDSRSRHVYACDLGTDEVLVFKFDTDKGTLESETPRSTKIAPGGGPRHFALHPSGRFAFANHEMGNAVTAFAVDAETGALTILNTLSTVPSDWKGGGTAEIVAHPGGRWLYVSNRGPDSIGVFRIEDDGRLTGVEIAAAGVKEPRGMDVDPTGRWLVVAGQNSDDLAVMAIDPSTGALRPSSKMTGLSKPVCVLFARPQRH